MEKVTGFGGFFFRAKDPGALALWYQDHLGIDPVPSGPGQEPWKPDGGTCAFAPFPADTTYFGNATQPWMLNFRVASLDAMIAQLRAAGVAVEPNPETYPYGRFARLHDPEGNPIELWEPAPE